MSENDERYTAVVIFRRTDDGWSITTWDLPDLHEDSYKAIANDISAECGHRKGQNVQLSGRIRPNVVAEAGADGRTGFLWLRCGESG